MRYVVGYINREGVGKVQLQELTKNGKPKGEPLEDEAFEMHGILTTDEQGRVILQEQEKPETPPPAGE